MKTMPATNTVKAIHFRLVAAGLWTIERVELPAAIDRKVEAIQKLVGGYFEVHTAKVARKKVLVYVNDEAALRGERWGFILGDGPRLLGPALLVSAKEDADLELSNRQIGNALRLFQLSIN